MFNTNPVKLLKDNPTFLFLTIMKCTSNGLLYTPAYVIQATDIKVWSKLLYNIWGDCVQCKVILFFALL